MAATEAEVAAAFRKNQFQLQGDDVAGRCVDLTAQYGISSTELSDAYDVFAFNKCVHQVSRSVFLFSSVTPSR